MEAGRAGGSLPEALPMAGPPMVLPPPLPPTRCEGAAYFNVGFTVMCVPQVLCV